jgi:ribonuclease J
LRVRIHRGSHEIGGSCVELEHGGRRLVLDLGLPLDADSDAVPVLPAIPGLRHPSDELAGIVVSHAHPDHFGLVAEVCDEAPVFGPADAQRMLDVGSSFTVRGGERRPWTPLTDGETRSMGPFAVTPLLVDHSAFEAYGLLVEAGGRRLLYTGDLRGHGRKAGLWCRLLEHPPKPVHVLLMEGTRLSRPEEHNTTEQEVEERLVDLCRQTPGLVLVFYSGQNIDRLVSVYRAAKRAGRTLVLDLYGAAVAAATGKATIPQADWDGVQVLVPHAQRRRVIERQAFEEIAAIRQSRIFHEELADRARSIVLTMRGSMTREVEQVECLDGAAAVWSMWPGYLEQPSGKPLQAWLADHDIPLTYMHSSGHASVADLKKLAAAIDPERLVPIHTATPERYTELFPRVEPHADGEWWAV